MRTLSACILGIIVLSLSACEMTASAVKSSFSDRITTDVNTAVSAGQSDLLDASSKAGTNLGSF